MNRLAKEVKDALITLRNDRWSGTLESLEDEGKSPWQIARALRKKSTAVPPIHGPTGIVYSDIDRAETFADRPELQTSPDFTHANLDHIEYVEKHVRRALQHSDNTIPKHITPAETRALLDRLPIHKAPGPDCIPNKALRSLGKKGTVALTNIFNSALRLRHFPTKWRTADVIVIPKSGNNLNFSQNYRPISLLSCIG